MQAQTQDEYFKGWLFLRLKALPLKDMYVYDDLSIPKKTEIGHMPSTTSTFS